MNADVVHFADGSSSFAVCGEFLPDAGAVMSRNPPYVALVTCQVCSQWLKGGVMTADDLARRRQACMKEVFDDLKKIQDEIVAMPGGWPNYSEDPALCMQRHCEFCDARDAYFERRGTTYEAFRATWEVK